MQYPSQITIVGAILKKGSDAMAYLNWLVAMFCRAVAGRLVLSMGLSGPLPAVCAFSKQQGGHGTTTTKHTPQNKKNSRHGAARACMCASMLQQSSRATCA